MVDEISPDKIQLNTIVRPPSDPRALSISRNKLEEIKNIIGDKAEIISTVSLKQEGAKYNSYVVTILEMVKRRPVSVLDISNALDIFPKEAERLLKGLIIKGSVKRKEHGGEVFYLLK